MPKVVDAEQRRDDIAEATVTVIARDGLGQATFANVATEAGLVIGSVRHYFGSQAEMVAYAMRRLADRIAGRILRTAEPVLSGDSLDPARGREITEEVFCQLLPLDDERRRESLAWLALSLAGINRPDLRPVVDELHDGVRSLARAVLSTMRLGFDEDRIDLEIERLAGLLDGLATDATLCPDQHPPERLRAVLRHHLDEVLGQ